MREAWAPRRGGGAQELKVRSQQYRSGRKSGRCEKSSQKVMMETVACRASCAWASRHQTAPGQRPVPEPRSARSEHRNLTLRLGLRRASLIGDGLGGVAGTCHWPGSPGCGVDAAQRSLCVRQVPRVPPQAASQAGGKPQMAHVFTGRGIIQKNSAQDTELISPFSCEKS